MNKSKFTELIAVRFTQEQLARLQEAASDQGIGASTLVRILVNQALRPASTKPRRMTSDEFREIIVSTLARLDKDSVNSFLKDVSIGNPNDPTLLVWAGQTEKWEDFTSHFLKALLASLGVEVTLPENEELLKVKKQSDSQVQGEQDIQGVTKSSF